jgi:flagellar motor switch protein FliN/FliY
MADDDQITDDDWAAAMQEQAATEASQSGDSEADRVAAELAAAARSA